MAVADKVTVEISFSPWFKRLVIATYALAWPFGPRDQEAAIHWIVDRCVRVR